MSYQTSQLVRALPGTLSELAERTGRTRPSVHASILHARREGVRIVARMQQKSAEREATTVYELDGSPE